MGIQFGKWNFDGKPVGPGLLTRAHALLQPFALFETHVVQMGSLAFIDSTGGTSHRSTGVPPQDAQNHVRVLWDGRIDNREELADLADNVPDSLTDTELIQKAYERAGTKVFPRIVGDWALSVLGKSERELILAKDSIGTRPLFYHVQNAAVTWCTVLEPLVLLGDALPALSEEYLTAWLSFFPECHLTPYRGIFSVPPASFVRITAGKASVETYWSLESSKPVRYQTDQQYEEHFLSVFREAVRRRINSDGPVLAELSGGMDSSSIVCMMDTLVAANASPRRFDTVTYFDSAESNWDELPYARKVEEKRGRTGHHINIGPEQGVPAEIALSRFHAVPTSTYARSSAAQTFDRIVSENGYRVVLSGVGGDEMVGGVPTPVPELADLLARLRGLQFLRQSFHWALAKKKPIIALWQSTVQSFLPWFAQNASPINRTWTWLASEFQMRNGEHLGFRQSRFHLLGELPSLQANTVALDVLSRQISCVPASAPSVYEWRYPFLDRELVTFCSSIPREQLVRPHQRRSLMRRALAGIVPSEILERKRKAYVSRGLVKVLAAEWQRLKRRGTLRGEEIGIFVSCSLDAAVKQAEQGNDVPIIPLLRTLALEQWLRDLSELSIQQNASPCDNAIETRIHDAPQELLGRERSR